MADFDLVLGDVTFQGFEIPDSIRGGGGQSLDIKKYGGGLRTVDAFGPDNAAIEWSGTFLDGTAESRCQQIDAMRVAGTPVQLSWSSFSYMVVISEFTWEFQKYYQIPYSIRLEVVTDQTQPVTDNGDDDPESDMQSDFDDADTYESALGDSTFSSNMSSVLSDLTGMPSITGASVPQLVQFAADVGTAQGRAQSIANAKEALLATTGLSANFASGTNPITMASNLNAMLGHVMALPNAYGASQTLTNLGDSIGQILGTG